MAITAFPALALRGPDVRGNALVANRIGATRAGNALASRRLDLAEGQAQRQNALLARDTAAAGQAAAVAGQPAGVERNQALLGLTALDPVRGKAMADAIAQMDDQQRENTVRISEQIGKISLGFLNAPQDQQAASWPQVRLSAIELGADPSEVPEVYGPEALAYVQEQATLAQSVNELAKRAFPVSDALSPEAEAQKIRIAQQGRAPRQPQTDAGKLVSDRALFTEQFGEDSEQVRAFDELAKSEGSKDVKLTDVAGLRKEFTAQSKDFVKVRDAFNKVRTLGAQDSAAGDLGMIFNIMKMFDPGSVVRESEFATAESAAGVPAQVRNVYNKLLTGERLAPEQRADFIKTAETIFASQSDSQRRLETSFRNIATRQNFDPANVIIDFGARTEATPIAPRRLRFDAEGNQIQ